MISNHLSSRPHVALALTVGWEHLFSSKLNELPVRSMEIILKLVMRTVPTKSSKILDQKCHFQILQFHQMEHSILNFNSRVTNFLAQNRSPEFDARSELYLLLYR